MPIPFNAPIEGYPNPGAGTDRHVLVIDKGNCWLYELYYAYPHGIALWSAASAAVWDLEANEQRPYTWTSADAAGLPIFPGLVRYDEVAAGHINHAIRMTLQYSMQAFTPPASHWAATSSNPLAAPMGMRVRLKANFDISGYPPEDQVILTALKQYGAIMADNGSSMFIGGTTDPRWNNDHLQQMRGVTASDFEVMLDFAAIHAAEHSHRSESDHQQLHRNLLRRPGPAGDLELDCDKRGVLHCVTFGGSDTRQQRRRQSKCDHNVHPVCDESVRPHDRHGDR